MASQNSGSMRSRRARRSLMFTARAACSSREELRQGSCQQHYPRAVSRCRTAWPGSVSPISNRYYVRTSMHIRSERLACAESRGDCLGEWALGDCRSSVPVLFVQISVELIHAHVGKASRSFSSNHLISRNLPSSVPSSWFMRRRVCLVLFFELLDPLFAGHCGARRAVPYIVLKGSH
jgi:hypothetical protein